MFRNRLCGISWEDYRQGRNFPLRDVGDRCPDGRVLSPAQPQTLFAEVPRRDPSAWEFVLAAGVDTRTIMALFGWSTMAMLTRYTHPGDEAKARAVAALGLAVEAKPGRVTPFRKRVEG